MPHILSPNKITLNNFSDLKRVEAKKELEIASPDQPDDHELLREMRRRIIDIIQEFEEIGEFDKHVDYCN